MPSYLVTGGLGFIGSHLVDALAAAGHRVRVVDDLSTGIKSNIPSHVELIEADLRAPGIVARALHGVDGCFHLAAVASVTRCNTEWHACHAINVGATVALFEEAAQQGMPVVYASSAAVYGDNPNVPLDETEPIAPLSPYGVDKAACEMHARVGASIHGLRALGLRFFNVYGPRQRPDDAYAGVITIFRQRLAKKSEILIYGDGQQTRDFIHVHDVTRGLLQSMERLEQIENQRMAPVLNLCTGSETSILKLAQLLMKEAAVEVPLHHQLERAGDIKRSAGSPQRAMRLLDWRACSMADRMDPQDTTGKNTELFR